MTVRTSRRPRAHGTTGTAAALVSSASHTVHPERPPADRCPGVRCWAWLVGCAFVLAGCGDTRPIVVFATEVAVVEQSPLVEGRDGGQSARLWGYSVWIFGDTVLKVTDERGQNWHHNSFALTTDLDAADGIAALATPLDRARAPRYFLAPTAEEQAFNDAHTGDGCADPCGARWAVWPGAPVYDAARDRAIIPYAIVYAEPGAFNFRGVGQSFAVWHGVDNEPERPVVNPTARHPTLLFHEGEPGWGSAPVVVADHLYVFACEPDGLARPCLLASVPLEVIFDRSAWRYYDGGGWSASMKDAVPLFDGGVNMSIAFNRYLGNYLAVYSPPFSRDIMARTAPHLAGPWSRESVLYTVPGAHAPYDAFHHVEYDEEGGRVIYVSYSRPTGGWFGTEFALVRIVLERRGLHTPSQAVLPRQNSRNGAKHGHSDQSGSGLPLEARPRRSESSVSAPPS